MFAEQGDETPFSSPVQVSPPAVMSSVGEGAVCPLVGHSRATEGCFEERMYRQRHVGGARFLQYIFRRIGRMRRMWVRGGLAGLPLIYRPSIHPRCHFGQVLASDDEFDRQVRRSRRCLDWYAQWVAAHAPSHAYGANACALLAPDRSPFH